MDTKNREQRAFKVHGHLLETMLTKVKKIPTRIMNYADRVVCTRIRTYQLQRYRRAKRGGNRE